MWSLVMVAAGGALGSALRYLLALGATRWLGLSFPWGTLAANVLGSFALGVVTELSGERRLFGAQARLVLGTGVLGGFTTYSSFNLETLRLFEQGAHVRGGAYLVATVVVCLVAGVSGIALARALKA